MDTEPTTAAKTPAQLLEEQARRALPTLRVALAREA